MRHLKHLISVFLISLMLLGCSKAVPFGIYKTDHQIEEEMFFYSVVVTPNTDRVVINYNDGMYISTHEIPDDLQKESDKYITLVDKVEYDGYGTFEVHVRAEIVASDGFGQSETVVDTVKIEHGE